MSRYLISVYEPSDGEPPPADVLAQIYANLDALHADLRAAGAFVVAGSLAEPSTAIVVRADGEEALLSDGPLLKGDEYFLGGLAVIEVDDLEAARTWARRFVTATTMPIEVRPFAG